ncbi:hypothetical protein [Cardinium endosymbiont of Culicoides punctatus]|nr:hypothetical protein [Cardinium endosymbiont of Culicoides punctatus]
MCMEESVLLNASAKRLFPIVLPIYREVSGPTIAYIKQAAMAAPIPST